MVEKDLKRLIDSLELRVKTLEEQLAFSQQENDSLRNELVNFRLDKEFSGYDRRGEPSRSHVTYPESFFVRS